MSRLLKLGALIVIILACGLLLSKRSKTQTTDFDSSGPNSKTQKAKFLSDKKSGIQTAQNAKGNVNVPASQGEQGANNAPITTEDEFRQKFPGKWSIGKNQDGRRNYFAGGPAMVSAKTEADIPKILSEMAPLLDVPPGQILAMPPTLAVSTDASKTFEAKQFVDGLEVFGGVVRLHARVTDGAIFIIENQTVTIHGYNHQPAISQQQAAEILRQRYENKALEINFNRGPVLFGGATTELAWVFNIKFGAPNFHGVLAVVGANSGQVLSESNTTSQ